jgi:hypothetical protein
MYKEKNKYKDIAQSVSSRLETFNRDLGRAEQAYVEESTLRDIYEKNVSEAVRSEIELYKAKIKSLGIAQVSTKGSGGGRVLSRVVVKTPNTKPLVEAAEGSPPPDQGSVEYSSWTFKDWRMNASFELGQFDYALEQKFDVVLTEAEAESAKPFYLEVWELDSTGARIPSSVKIDSFKVYRRKPTSHFKLLDPHVELSITFMGNPDGFDFGPELSVSLSSYGNFRFIRGGVWGGREAFGLSVSPFSINLGRVTGLLDNLWVSPAYFLSNESFYGASIGATF